MLNSQSPFPFSFKEGYILFTGREAWQRDFRYNLIEGKTKPLRMMWRNVWMQEYISMCHIFCVSFMQEVGLQCCTGYTLMMLPHIVQCCEQTELEISKKIIPSLPVTSACTTKSPCCYCNAKWGHPERAESGPETRKMRLCAFYLA